MNGHRTYIHPCYIVCNMQADANKDENKERRWRQLRIPEELALICDDFLGSDAAHALGMRSVNDVATRTIVAYLVNYYQKLPAATPDRLKELVEEMKKGLIFKL